MASEAEQNEKARQIQMLRRLKVGSRVATTIRSPFQGRGTVVGLDPAGQTEMLSDGVRRITVRFDDKEPLHHVLPSSIMEVDDD